MKRLTHSLEGYLRFMQMSQAQVFLLVEGRDPDPYVYGKIATKSLGQRFAYEICRAEEIDREGGGGGKSALLRFFMHLESNGQLGGDFKGKRWFAVFFLDKDVDDLLGAIRSSPHIIYTAFYDIENHIYSAGDLREAAAASATVDIHEAPPTFANSLAWRRSAANRWKQWVFLCLLVSRLGVSCACGYRLKSSINVPPNAYTTQDIEPYLETIRQASGREVAQFQAAVEAVRGEVEEFYQVDEFDKIFKGKWYASILHADLLEHLSGRAANRNALETRLTPAIAQTLDVDGEWSTRFVAKLNPLVLQFLG